MDMTVRGIGAVVVAELRAAGYLESTIGQYSKTIRALAEYASQRGGVYSLGLGAEFASMTISPRTGRFSAQRRLDYRRLTGVFDSYMRTGRVDLSVRGRGGGGPRPGQAELAVLDAAWEADMAGRGLAPATRAAYGRVTRSYLVFLEQRGIAGLDAAVNLAGVRRSRPVIPVLSDDDQELAVRACASGAVSARDAAITLLALSTGLRACDIIALRLADVDWRGQ